jgi:hypothetical protein
VDLFFVQDAEAFATVEEITLKHDDCFIEFRGVVVVAHRCLSLADDDLFQHDGLEGFVARGCIYASNGINDVHASGYFAKDAMSVVEPGSGFMCDKELAAVGVGASIRHAEDTWAIVGQFGMKFIFKTVAWATCSGAEWATALDHKVFDNTVECQTIIKWNAGLDLPGTWICPFFGASSETDKVGNGIGYFVIEQLDGEVSLIGVEISECSHDCLLWFSVLWFFYSHTQVRVYVC